MILASHLVSKNKELALAVFVLKVCASANWYIVAAATGAENCLLMFIDPDIYQGILFHTGIVSHKHPKIQEGSNDRE